MKKIEDWLSLCTFTLRYIIFVVGKAILHQNLLRNERPPTTLFPKLSSGWLTNKLRELKLLKSTESVKSIIPASELCKGGFVGEVLRFHIEYHSSRRHNAPETLILKTTKATFSAHYFYAGLGTPREALWYDRVSDLGYSPRLPNIYYSYGNVLTGESVILMEDLKENEWILCSKVLGNQCWGPVVEHPSITVSSEDASAMIKKTFSDMGKLHAKHWNNAILLRQPWLKARLWVQGEDRLGFEKCMDSMRHTWKFVKDVCGMKWSDLVIETMNKSLECSTWENYQLHMNTRKNSFTLCHGDFHAGNVLVSNDLELCYVDWSDVGISHGPVELSQYLISNAQIDLRRKGEKDWAREYYETLVANGVSSSEYSWEICWRQYRHGGIERWLQLLVILAALKIKNKIMPEDALQWFHDQVLAFLEDHVEKDQSYPLLTGYNLTSYL